MGRPPTTGVLGPLGVVVPVGGFRPGWSGDAEKLAEL